MSAWTPHKVAVWESWSRGRFLAFKTNFYGPWHLSDDGGQTALFTDDSLQEVMRHAEAMEATTPTAPSISERDNG